MTGSSGGADLDPATGALVGLGAALATGSAASLEEALRRAHRDAPPAAVEETILQSYLFLGYPAALNAFARWREVSGRPPPEPEPDDPDAWEARGEDVCRRVYGDQYGSLRENIRALHPDLERWMVAEGYGKVLGRDGLDLATRELVVAAILAVIGAAPQLYSHLRGAVRSGAEPGTVDAALEAVLPLADPVARGNAEDAWRRVRSRFDESAGER